MLRIIKFLLFILEHGDEEESEEEESSMTAQEINKLNSALFKLLTVSNGGKKHKRK